MSEYDVVLIGAGIAGSAIAHGLPVPDRNVGELLQPGGMATLNDLGPLVRFLSEGRSFHHGRFVMRLREAASQHSNVDVIGATVSELIEDKGRIIGVRARRKDRDEETPISVKCPLNLRPPTDDRHMYLSDTVTPILLRTFPLNPADLFDPPAICIHSRYPSHWRHAEEVLAGTSAQMDTDWDARLAGKVDRVSSVVCDVYVARRRSGRGRSHLILIRRFIRFILAVSRLELVAPTYGMAERVSGIIHAKYNTIRPPSPMVTSSRLVVQLKLGLLKV
ncbi:Squalene monooxygenase [Ceratobasidium theobromae]|uniref:Squalene monooxygenase n=1 Tax=Ceratobasidium theobromae TaxID=1582974 RepID=A0A5N5QL95_9AGAM|nr:Squalene monooxygenase [Ceratobasidium theobromae]